MEKSFFQETLSRGIVQPARPLHVEYIRLAFGIAAIICGGVFAFAFTISLTALAAGAAVAWLAMVFGGLAVSILFAFVPLAVVIRRAYQSLEWYREQSEANQDTNRQIALTRAEINISGGKNTVVVGDQITNTNTNTLAIAQSRDQTIAEFMRHYADFLTFAKFKREIGDGKTGFERALYIVDGNPAQNYQFSDGARIDRAEYERIIKYAETQGHAPEDRRKGSAGTRPAEIKQIDG